MTSWGRQYLDGPLEPPPGWPGRAAIEDFLFGEVDPAAIEDFFYGGVFFEVERAPDGTPVSVRHLPREQALGSFLHSMLGGGDPEPGPPYVHTLVPPEPIGYDEDDNPLYPEPGPAMTLTEGPAC